MVGGLVEAVVVGSRRRGARLNGEFFQFERVLTLVKRWRSNVVFSLPLKVDRAWRRLKIFSSCVCVCLSRSSL